ncbi:hypothetical protein [Lentibacillus sp. CBA3610]|uniref:hypothetical protein n=1 Tax=Lentibacillus sp. CBA3610 TaxID=2518176 RepID=UPI00159542F2|nr:hypothetical protein [Lentibacillus sp. CBA3610]QKY70501.1 hypothetical protein Len3610_13700 [Lentibacillus sp. CBA3610]
MLTPFSLFGGVARLVLYLIGSGASGARDAARLLHDPARLLREFWRLLRVILGKPREIRLLLREILGSRAKSGCCCAKF